MKKIIILIILSLLWNNNLIAEEYPNSWKIDLLCKQGKSEWALAAYVVNVDNYKFFKGMVEKTLKDKTNLPEKKYFLIHI